MAEEFGPYVTEALVARTRTATVWRARHRDLGRLAAVKVLSPQLAADERVLALLRAEARHLTELDDPHIVSVYDFVDAGALNGHAANGDRAPYLVTEWVEGESLRALLDRVGKLTPQQALGVMRGALLGLACAHDRSLVHGDVSTSNILVTRDGTSKLIDFGLAAPAGEPGVSGTPAYLSPEAASGAALLPASDVYSAAALLHELLAGSPLFPGDSALAVIHAHREQPAPPLAGHGPELSALLQRALQKDPARRPANAREFLAELEAAAETRFGAGWLSGASVAALAGAGGAAAGAVATEMGATATISTAPSAAGSVLTTASADTGAVSKPVPKPRPRIGRMGHVITSHPVVAATAAVVVVAAAVTGTVVATSGTDRPKPPPEAVLLASSPQGAFVATGAITSSTDTSVKKQQLGPYPWTVTEQCGPKFCDAVVKAPGSTFRFRYAGQTFTSTTTNATRETCIDQKTRKEVPGSTALRHHTVVWTLQVTKRAPDTPDGPGRALELAGTATETNSYSDLTNNCKDVIGKTVTKYSYTIRRK